MAAIDIGSAALNRNTGITFGQTIIDLTNPANGTGRLTSFEVWMALDFDATGVKAGTLYGSGTDYTSRDVETIGNVTSGSKQTFSGLDCTVSSGDFAGIYMAAGRIESEPAGGSGSGIYKYTGDAFGAGLKTYTIATAVAISLYGIGSTPGWANINNVRMGTGVVLATDIAYICMGTGKIDVADISDFNGVAV